MNEINSIISVILQQSQKTTLNTQLTNGTDRIWDRHRLISHPWIYTDQLTGFIHWDLNGREHKSEIFDWRIDSDYYYYCYYSLNFINLINSSINKLI